MSSKEYISLPFPSQDLLHVVRRLPVGGPYAFSGPLEPEQLEPLNYVWFEVALGRSRRGRYIIIGERGRVDVQLGPEDTEVQIHTHSHQRPYPSSWDIYYMERMRLFHMPKLAVTGVLTPESLVLWSIQNNRGNLDVWRAMPDYDDPEAYVAFANRYGVRFEVYPPEQTIALLNETF